MTPSGTVEYTLSFRHLSYGWLSVLLHRLSPAIMVLLFGHDNTESNSIWLFHLMLVQTYGMEPVCMLELFEGSYVDKHVVGFLGDCSWFMILACPFMVKYVPPFDMLGQAKMPLLCEFCGSSIANWQKCAVHTRISPRPCFALNFLLCFMCSI